MNCSDSGLQLSIRCGPVRTNCHTRPHFIVTALGTRETPILQMQKLQLSEWLSRVEGQMAGEGQRGDSDPISLIPKP